MSRRSPFEVLSRELFAHMSVITGKCESCLIISNSAVIPSELGVWFYFRNPSEGYNLPLDQNVWYSYLAEQYTIFSAPRTGSEFHVQLPLYYEGYSKDSVPMTGSSGKYTSIHVDWRSTPSTAFLSMGHSTPCSISSLPCLTRLVLHLSPLITV